MGRVKFFDNCQKYRQQILKEYFVRISESELKNVKKWVPGMGSRNFCIITKGEMSMYQNDPKKDKAAIKLYTFTKDDFCGEISLFHDVISGGRVAKEGIEIYQIKGNNPKEKIDNLKKLFTQYPQIACNVFSEMAWRLFHTQRYTPSHDVKTRLKYLFAIEQAEKPGDDVRLSLHQIEQSIGVARNSVKTSLHALVRSGVLSAAKDSMGYSYKIIDQDKLLKGLRFRNKSS
jgi:CRP-like cAMP-binding protein